MIGCFNVNVYNTTLNFLTYGIGYNGSHKT